MVARASEASPPCCRGSCALVFDRASRLTCGPASTCSTRWQCRGLYAEFWETASREKGRLYELAGYMAGAGEQLALACLADHEFSQWVSA